jgi:hypothetical protein
MPCSACVQCIGNRKIPPVLNLGAVVVLALCAEFAPAPALAQSNSFGPITVPGTAVIFDPDNVLSADQLIPLDGGGSLHATPAVKAISFDAAPGQSFTFSTTGLVGCCGVAQIGPSGYPGDRANITSLGSISGFVSPVGLPLVGVFTNGSPTGSAPPPYDYSGGVGQPTASPLLNQVFIIGNGASGSGVQVFEVPATATELWLGFPDAGTFAGHPGNYADNAGSESVAGTLMPSCVPTPGSNPISSQTVATVPGTDPSRTCIGVNESIVLTATQAATWSIASTDGDVQLATQLQAYKSPFNLVANGGFPTQQCAPPAPSSGPIYGKQVCFIAPMTAASILVTATFDNGQSASKTFAVFQPNGLIFQRQQYPLKSPDYSFSNDYLLGLGFNIEMESLVFVTPGNVSFAYIGFSEHDRDDPFFGVRFNSLFNVAGTHAWLVSCDHDQEVGQTLVPAAATHDWVFAATPTSAQRIFSRATTSVAFNILENFPNGTAYFSKGQAAALLPNGNMVPTPGAAAAVLNVVGVNFNDFAGVSDSTTCLNMVKTQFANIP